MTSFFTSSFSIGYRKFPDIFGRYNHLSETIIRNLVDKFESTGSVHNIPTTRVHPGRLVENIAAVSESVEEDIISMQNDVLTVLNVH